MPGIARLHNLRRMQVRQTRSVMLPIFQMVMDLMTLPSPKSFRPRESCRKG